MKLENKRNSVAFIKLFLNFALMLHLIKPYNSLPSARLKTGSIAMLVSLLLMGIIAPLITVVVFQMNFDKHLTECRQHRQHDEDCQAQCVLGEMMPGRTDPMTDHFQRSFYFFPPLFFQDRTLDHTASLKDAMAWNHFFHFLRRYLPPRLEISTPPPKF